MRAALLAITALSWLISASVVAVYAFGIKGIIDSVKVLRGQRALARANYGKRPASVIIPARDERRNIGALVRSLLVANGLSSLTVVDDGSSDGTAVEALRAAEGDERLLVLRVEERPRGWAPKAFAEHEGALTANGEVLIFLDADVGGRPDIAVSLASSEVSDGVLLAFEPRFLCEGPFCSMSQPVLSAILHGFYGFHRAVDPSSRHSLIYGCCWATTPYTFWEAGGMAKVRDRLLEDRTLAVILKTRGVRLRPIDARDLLTVKSWGSPSDMINLLRRISIDTMRSMSLPAYLAASVGIAFLFLWPWAAIPLAALRLWAAALGPALAYAAQVAFVSMGASVTRIRRPWALLAPVVGLFIVYGIVSSRWAQIVWKGRVYG